MPAPSTIKRLPKKLQDDIEAALEESASCDAVVDLVRSRGFDVSRSAVGRYKLDYQKVVEDGRRRQQEVKALAARLGDPDSDQVKFMVQLGLTAGTDALVALLSRDDAELTPGDFEKLGKGLNQMTSAAKSHETIIDIRVKRERAQAADRAEVAGRAAGATEDTIATIRAAILDEAA